jgi:endoglucanase
MKKLIFLSLICTLITIGSLAQVSESGIRLNQIGFYPDAPKIAVITETGSSEFLIKSADSGEVLFKFSNWSGRFICI